MLTNRKPEDRAGQVQLIDATQWFRPLRKNMGKKNCELSPEDIQRICDSFLAFDETEQSKKFPNAAFGYWKVKVERPLRLHSQFSFKAIESLRFASGDEDIRSELYEELGEDLFEKPSAVRKKLQDLVNNWGKSGDSEDEEGEATPARKAIPAGKKKKLLNEATWKRDARLMEIATQLRESIGDDLFENHNVFLQQIKDTLKELDFKLPAADHKAIVNAVSWRVEGAPEVIKKIHKPGKGEKAARTAPDPLRGRYQIEIDGETCIVEYEPDTELRDHEQISFLEAPDSGQPGGLPTQETTREGIESFIRREVLPYTPDAWIVESDTKIGYEISFTRHFYKPPKLRTLAQISADIHSLENETEGLLEEITGGAK